MGVNDRISVLPSAMKRVYSSLFACRQAVWRLEVRQEVSIA